MTALFLDMMRHIHEIPLYAKCMCVILFIKVELYTYIVHKMYAIVTDKDFMNYIYILLCILTYYFLYQFCSATGKLIL